MKPKAGNYQSPRDWTQRNVFDTEPIGLFTVAIIFHQQFSAMPVLPSAGVVLLYKWDQRFSKYAWECNGDGIGQDVVL